MMRNKNVLIVIGCLFLTGCAYVSASPYDADRTTRGIAIPEQIPLLVVSGDNTSVIYANNPNKGIALKFGSFLAKHKLDAEFSPNGSLAKISSDQDTTEIGLKLIELVRTAVEKGTPIGAAFSGKSGNAGGTVNRFGVFAFDFDEYGNFVGLIPMINSSGLITVPKKAGVVQAPPGDQPIKVD